MQKTTKIFISYAREDLKIAEKLYIDLLSAGFDPWFDKAKLKGGERWKNAIIKAIKSCDYFISILSAKSTQKRGYVQAEIKDALFVLKQIPDDQIYFIPIRIDDCIPSYLELEELNWIDFFPNYEDGFAKLFQSIKTTIPGVEKQFVVFDENINHSTNRNKQFVDFDSALNLLNEENQIVLKSSLPKFSNSSVTNFRFVRNFKNESRLPQRIFLRLFDLFITEVAEKDLLKQHILETCWQNSLIGPNIDIGEAIECVSIFDYDSLIYRLLNQYTYMFHSKKDIIEFISNFNSYKVKEPFSEILISRFSQWCTFNKGDNPIFRNADGFTKDDYLTLFGVSAGKRKIIIVRYFLPEDIHLQYPTICDAAFTETYSSSSKDDKHGWIIPWTDNPKFKPIPESVHRPIKLKDIIELKIV